MIIYEIVTIITAVLAAGMTGASLHFAFYLRRVLDENRSLIGDKIHFAELELVKTRKQLAEKVKEFDEVTKKASEANNSMGSMLADLENKVVAIDERFSMMQGTATVTGAGNSWQKMQQPHRKA